VLFLRSSGVKTAFRCRGRLLGPQSYGEACRVVHAIVADRKEMLPRDSEARRANAQSYPSCANQFQAVKGARGKYNGEFKMVDVLADAITSEVNSVCAPALVRVRTPAHVQRPTPISSIRVHVNIGSVNRAIVGR
jgi:hypothetical protein